jgi:AcrR family transcriptional regulator
MTNAAPAQTTRPAGRRRLPPDERRELIVASASRLFERKPYSQVSTVEIAREAGIARGLLNHYFKDKRGLYLEVVRRAVLLPLLETLPSPDGGTSREQVDAAVAWFLDSVDAQAASYFTVLGSEGVAHDPEVAAIIEEADDLAARRVLQLVGLDEDDDLARAMVRCYGGLAKATLREWIRGQTLSREQAHTLLSEVLVFMTENVLAPGGRGAREERAGVTRPRGL